MVKLKALLTILFLAQLISCAYHNHGNCERRDQKLQTAESQLISDNKNSRIQAIRTFSSNQTYQGLRTLVKFWLLENDDEVVKEFEKGIEKFEEFRYSDSFIDFLEEQIKLREATSSVLEKAKHLLYKSKADKARNLISRIDERLQGKH